MSISSRTQNLIVVIGPVSIHLVAHSIQIDLDQANLRHPIDGWPHIS
jgi:hypothetical protein